MGILWEERKGRWVTKGGLDAAKKYERKQKRGEDVIGVGETRPEKMLNPIRGGEYLVSARSLEKRRRDLKSRGMKKGKN